MLTARFANKKIPTCRLDVLHHFMCTGIKLDRFLPLHARHRAIRITG